MTSRPARSAARRAPRPGIAPVVASLAPVCAVMLAACDRDRPPARVDTPTAVASAPVPAAGPAPAAAPTSRWDGEVGLALVVPGVDGEALLVVPGSGAPDAPADTTAGALDASTVGAGMVALYGPAGAVGEARLTPVAIDGVAPGARRCTPWPRARLGPAAGADAVPAWTVGLLRRGDAAAAPTALPLDSLAGLAGRDSAAVAATVTRLAAALPATQGAEAARFRGVPFAVRAARRFIPAPGTQGLVAVVGRALAQEAEPVAEEVLLVAERAEGGEWRVGHAERVSGDEERLPAVSALAAFRLGDASAGRAVVVLGYEGGERGTHYAVLERTGPGAWRVRWASPTGGC